MLVERVETGLQLQQGTARSHEAAERAGTRGFVDQMPLAKIAKQQLQNFELESATPW